MIYNYNKLTPFKKYIIQNFPYIDADFDALNNYGLYCKVVEYLNKVIDEMNGANEQVEILTNAFNDLHDYVQDYFENLDVQDEINNKLDEMASTGVLQEIVNAYFSVITEEITEQNGKITTLESRMDGFTHLTEGSTTGDAELIDGRVSFDGRTFTNIGGNIRGFQGAYWNNITESLTKFEGRYIKSTYQTQILSTYNFYQLQTKLGYLYYIDTCSSGEPKQIVYGRNKTIPSAETTGDYNDPIIFEGTGTIIYINSLVANTFAVYESKKFDNIDEISTYFRELTIAESGGDVTLLANKYVSNSGSTPSNNSYNLYQFNAKKGYIYYFKTATSSGAPLIYQNGPKPFYASSYDYKCGYYQFISLTDGITYINCYKNGMNLNEVVKIYESYQPIYKEDFDFDGLIADAVFCGDSLTYGQTYTSANAYYQNYYNYPYYLKKLLSIDNIDEYARGGATAVSWWNEFENNITKSNSTYFVWLGTNSTNMTDTVETDCAGTDYTQYADTETGTLGKILGKINSLSNNKIVIMNCFSSSGTLATVNKVISELASKFNAILVDLNNADIKLQKYHTAYNGQYNAVHFNSLGNNYVANMIKNKITSEVTQKGNIFENYKVHE